MNRRSFMQSMLALGMAPWVMSNGVAGGVLMPVRQIAVPSMKSGYYCIYAPELNNAEKRARQDVMRAMVKYYNEQLISITFGVKESYELWREI